MVYGKLVDKTLTDVDYTELAELVYGQQYSSDVARRMMYGSRKTLELLDLELVNNIGADELLNELENKKNELRKEQQRFYDQRREYNKLVANDGRKEHLYEMLSKSANNLPETVGLISNHDKPVLLQFLDDCEGVLVLSDWHYGMKTKNVFNEYNTNICKQRVSKVIDDTIARLTLHKCRKLHIVILGDLCHGGIHLSARVASEELVCDQLMQVSEILAQTILELNNYVEETCVYMTYGNHMRTIQNKNDSIHRDNMERIVPWWLEQRIRAEEKHLGTNLNITIVPDNDTEFLFVDSCGHEICAAHGDLDSVKSSPRLLSTLFQKKCGKNIEYIILGDKHHRESFDELCVEAMICGSLCGSDEYANNKRLYSTPSQLLLIVNEKDGVDAEYKIKCD